jgi:hypothetical protein
MACWDTDDDDPPSCEQAQMKPSLNGVPLACFSGSLAPSPVVPLAPLTALPLVDPVDPLELADPLVELLAVVAVVAAPVEPEDPADDLDEPQPPATRAITPAKLATASIALLPPRTCMLFSCPVTVEDSHPAHFANGESSQETA